MSDKNECRQQWQVFAGMTEPISDDCLCADPPDEDHQEEARRDPDNPSCHSQYCPVYLYAYALAMAEGKELPE